MSAIKWKSNYEVGIPELDRQHQKLVRIINALYEAFKVGASKEVLHKTLSDLIDYSVTHFSCEEALMERYDYPGQEQHLEKHKTFCDWVLDKRDRAASRNNGVGGSVLIYLRQWLIDHISSEDQVLSRYLRDRGVFEIEAEAITKAE